MITEDLHVTQEYSNSLISTYFKSKATSLLDDKSE